MWELLSAMNCETRGLPSFASQGSHDLNGGLGKSGASIPDMEVVWQAVSL